MATARQFDLFSPKSVPPKPRRGAAADRPVLDLPPSMSTIWLPRLAAPQDANASRRSMHWMRSTIPARENLSPASESRPA
jgi:hypothetical protein